jgi:predicted nucleic acid-binding protein
MWLQLLHEGHDIVAPTLLFSECTSVLRGQAYDGTISHAESVDSLRELLGLPIEIVGSPGIYATALDIAARLHHRKAYDAHYIAAAQIRDCELLTLDKGLFQGAVRVKAQARLVA